MAHHPSRRWGSTAQVTKGLTTGLKAIFISDPQGTETADILNTQKKEKKKNTVSESKIGDKECTFKKKNRQNLRKELNKHKQFRMKCSRWVIKMFTSRRHLVSIPKRKYWGKTEACNNWNELRVCRKTQKMQKMQKGRLCQSGRQCIGNHPIRTGKRKKNF